MFDKGAIVDLSANLKQNRNELEKLIEEYDYLKRSHKSLFNQVKSTIKSVDSYYENSNELMHSFVQKSGNVKRAYEEMNVLVEGYKIKLDEVNTSMDVLSDKYKAPKEEIAKVIEQIQKYAALDKEITERESKGESGGYIKDLKNELKKIKSNIKSNLAKEMWADYDNGNDELRKQIDLKEELLTTTDKVARAQSQVTKEIERGTDRLERFKKNGLGDILTSVGNAVKSFAVSGYDKLKEVDQASRDFGRNMGMSAEQMDKHRSHMVNNWGQMAKQLGMDFNEMYKFQTGYADATDKAIILTDKQVSTMAALSRNTGEQALSVANKNLDIFSSSADASIDYMAKAVARASLEGLNVKKYSDAFANNIKMASKYTFKEGISGIQQMTLLSQRLKFNMESISAAMDKFSTIEGAIETSAKIQVLGGSFAQNFGNPLVAMSDALLDAEGFTKRIIETVASHARFNSKTGEIDLSPQDKMRLKAYSEALGISYDEVHNMATQSQKEKIISNVVSGKGLTKQQEAFLINKAQYNKETGKWHLTDVNGEKLAKDISQMTSDEINTYRNTDKYEKILTADTSQIVSILKENAKEEKSIQEIQKGWKEFSQLYSSSFINDFLPWIKIALPAIAIANVSGGLGNYVKGGKGIVTSFKKGGFIRNATAAMLKTTNRIPGVGRAISNGGKYLAAGSKVVRVGGGLLSAGFGAYEVGNSIVNYNRTKNQITNDNSINVDDKAKSLNDAKIQRNKGVGSGAGAAIGGVIGSFIPIPIVGTMLGSAVGGLVGSIVGESVTESVDETKKELMKGNDETNKNEKIVANTTFSIDDKLGKIYGLISSPSFAVSKNVNNNSYISSVEQKNTSQLSAIKVEDMKLNIDGKIQLVGNNGKTTDMNDILSSKEFRTAVEKIMVDAFERQPIGKPQRSHVS